MKNIVISAVLLFAIELKSMDLPDRAFLCEQDGNGDVWVNDGRGGRVKETYVSPFYSLSETRNEDDTKKNFTIPEALFIQLVVQAWKVLPTIFFSDPDDLDPFHELMVKIGNGDIELKEPVIALTHKDAKHRLLSYIPKGKVNQLVNGKKIRMSIIVGTRLVDMPNKVEQRTIIPLVEEDFPIDPAGLVFPEIGQGKSSRGEDIELTGQDTLSSNYDFLSDAAHHQTVVAEFKSGLRSKID